LITTWKYYGFFPGIGPGVVFGIIPFVFGGGILWPSDGIYGFHVGNSGVMLGSLVGNGSGVITGLIVGPMVGIAPGVIFGHLGGLPGSVPRLGSFPCLSSFLSCLLLSSGGSLPMPGLVRGIIPVGFGVAFTGCMPDVVAVVTVEPEITVVYGVNWGITVGKTVAAGVIVAGAGV
jgi:hypothetical protein